MNNNTRRRNGGNGRRRRHPSFPQTQNGKPSAGTYTSLTSSSSSRTIATSSSTTKPSATTTISPRIFFASIAILLVAVAQGFSVTTFNILAPVHRSMHGRSGGVRESSREDWWRPRAEGVARYITEELASSDVILLQEWWFDEQFESLFDSIAGQAFDRVSERRPGGDPPNGAMRDDGMCVLIRKGGRLKLIDSSVVITGPQRIAQIVRCEERTSGDDDGGGGGGREVLIANAHLSFPGHDDMRINERRQTREINVVARALNKAGRAGRGIHHLHRKGRIGRRVHRNDSNDKEERIEIIAGDFNSESLGMAASTLESTRHGFVNAASALAVQCMMGGVGGPLDLGATHCNHLGELMSCDHLFVRRRENNNGNHGGGVLEPSSSESRFSAHALGYLDTKGTRVANVRTDDMVIEGRAVLSDHRPVTMKIAWPRRCASSSSSGPAVSAQEARAAKDRARARRSPLYANATMPLDPLEPAWGIFDA